jgi:creatinine amidohydrolase
MSEIEWRKLRADQLRDLAKRDAIVIVPVGSLEQHGPHLPVEVDSMLGEQVAHRTARLMDTRGQPVAVLPMLWTGLSEHHMSFGGTITLDQPTFAGVIECICRSVQRHGFNRVVLLNSHGGNENALRHITDDLTSRLGLPIVEFTYWLASTPEIASILEQQKELHHACEAETSMMLAVRPELVAHDRIALAKSNLSPSMLDIASGGGVYRWRTTYAMSASGVVGVPEAATADKGNRLFDAISKTLANKLCNSELWQLPRQAQPPG